jgi:hypothetical protein
MAPGVNSLQIAEVQLYGDVFIDPVPNVPVPEPATFALLIGAFAFIQRGKTNRAIPLDCTCQ